MLTPLPSPRSLHRVLQPTELLSRLHRFVCWIVHSFISQVLGAPCSHIISFSGASWLKPELGKSCSR